MEWKGRLVNRLYGVTEATLEESDNPRQCGEKNAEPGARGSWLESHLGSP